MAQSPYGSMAALQRQMGGGGSGNQQFDDSFEGLKGRIQGMFYQNHQPIGRFDNMSDDALEQMWQQYPGTAPGGTGPTGLASFDANGWSSLQSRNAKYMTDRGAKQGIGRQMGGMPPSIADDPNSSFNTNPDVPGNPGSIGALQRQMEQPTYGGGAPTMRQQADDLYRKKYPGLSANSGNSNIVWGS